MATTKKVSISLNLEGGVFKSGNVSYRIADGTNPKSGFGGRLMIKAGDIPDIKNKIKQVEGI